MKYTAEEVKVLAQRLHYCADKVLTATDQYNLLTQAADCLESGTVRIMDAVGEPVAWMFTNGTDTCCLTRDKDWAEHSGFPVTPLYASPLPTASPVDEREAFERACARLPMIDTEFVRHLHGYSDVSTDYAWMGWQAARRVPAEQRGRDGKWVQLGTQEFYDQVNAALHQLLLQTGEAMKSPRASQEQEKGDE